MASVNLREILEYSDIKKGKRKTLKFSEMIVDYMELKEEKILYSNDSSNDLFLTFNYFFRGKLISGQKVRSAKNIESIRIDGINKELEDLNDKDWKGFYEILNRFRENELIVDKKIVYWYSKPGLTLPERFNGEIYVNYLKNSKIEDFIKVERNRRLELEL